MATFLFETWLNQSPSTAIVTVGGTVIFDGEVGPGQPIGTTLDLVEYTGDESNVTVTVTSGSIKVGQVQPMQNYPQWSNLDSYWPDAIVVYTAPGGSPMAYKALQAIVWSDNIQIDNTAYWEPYGNDTFYWGLDCRSNILLNGVAPSWPSTPPYPGGDAANPDWQGWFFDAYEGDTVTFTIVSP